MGLLIFRPHVLSVRNEISRPLTELEIESGLTPLQIIDPGVPPAIRPYLVVEVNGEEVPEEAWATRTFARGDHVLIAMRPGGGRGGAGKQVLALVAAIGLAVSLPAFGGWIASTYGLSAGAGSAIAGAAGVVATAAITMLIAPPSATIGQSLIEDRGPARSRAYGFTGQQNVSDPYGVIPRVYGRHRIAPRLAAVPRITSVGKTQFITMLYDFGYGPLDLEDIRIGDTPITAYRDVQVKVHDSFVAGNTLSYYSKDSYSVQVNSVLRLSTNVVQRTPANTKRVAVTLVFPRGLADMTNSASGNPRNQAVMVRLQWRRASAASNVAYSSWRTTAPQTVSWSSYNVRGDNVVLGTGQIALETWTEDGVTFYGYRTERETLTVRTYNGKSPQQYAGSVKTAFGQFRVVSVEPGVNAAWKLKLETPHPTFRQRSPSELAMEYFTAGAGSDLEIVAAETEAFAVEVGFELPDADTYDIRVTRMTAEATSAFIVDEVQWATLRSENSDPPIVPAVPHTILEVRIRATDQLSGVVDNLTAVAVSRLFVWRNGVQSTTREATRNPAWVFVDILTGRANARAVPVSMLDMPTIQAWAAFCDRELSTAEGGPGKFAMCDMVVDYRTTVMELLNTVASIGRAVPTMRDGKFSVIQESPSTLPVQLITPHNSWGLEFSRRYPDYPHGVKVRYVNPRTWQQDEVIVYATGYNAQNASRFEELNLVGCTRRAQAAREGFYFLVQSYLRRETVTVKMDVENLAVLRGDKVLLAHDAGLTGAQPARVTAVTSTTIVIDEDLPYDLNIGVRIRAQNGTIGAPRAATLAAGTTDTLIVGTGHGASVGDLVLVGYLANLTWPYIVKAIRPGPDLTATLTLIEERPEIYSLTNTIPAYFVPDSGEPVGWPQTPPTNLRITTETVYSGRVPMIRIVLTWAEPQQGASSYRIFEQIAGQSTQVLAQTAATTYVVPTMVASNALPANGQTRVYSVAATNINGGMSTTISAQIQLNRDLTPPRDVTVFGGNVQSETLKLYWDPSPDPDTIGYELRFTDDLSDVRWTRANRLPISPGYDTTSVSLPLRFGAYLIKAFDISNNYSVNHKELRVTPSNLPGLKQIQTLVMHPNFVGTMQGATVYASELRLAKVNGFYPDEAWYYHTARITLDQAWLIRLVASPMKVRGARQAALIGEWAPLESAVPLDPSQTFEGWAADMMYRVVDPAVPGASFQPLIAADMTARTVEFAIRLRSSNPYQTPAVAEAGIVVYIKERTERVDAVAVGSGGLTVVFNKPFYENPAVTVTILNPTSGDRVEVSAVSRSQFTVLCRDSAGTAVARTVAWVASGHGQGA